MCALHFGLILQDMWHCQTLFNSCIDFVEKLSKLFLNFQSIPNNLL